MRFGHINKKLLRWLLPVAIVILSVFLLQVVFSQRTYHIRGITPQDGVLDIRDADVSSCVFNIANEWDFYPEALYTSEDFTSGAAGVKAGPEESASDTPYGTHRLRILAQPNQYYTICSFSLDYASRVFVNGSEVAAFGRVVDNAEDFVPQVGYMTIPWFPEKAERSRSSISMATMSIRTEDISSRPTYRPRRIWSGLRRQTIWYPCRSAAACCF